MTWTVSRSCLGSRGCAETDEPIETPFGDTGVGPRKQWGSRPHSRWMGTFEKDIMPAGCSVPPDECTAHSSPSQRSQRTCTFTAVSGDKTRRCGPLPNHFGHSFTYFLQFSAEFLTSDKNRTRSVQCILSITLIKSNSLEISSNYESKTVFLCAKAAALKTANIKILSTDLTHRSWLSHQWAVCSVRFHCIFWTTDLWPWFFACVGLWPQPWPWLKLAGDYKSKS